MNRKKAMQLTAIYENMVYTSMDDIYQLIQMHTQLGMSEMEVFIEKKKSQKFAQSLRKKGFYCRIFEFKALEHECKFYVSWISNF
jgi:uncharacterized protein YfkK (UPF0435 family)